MPNMIINFLNKYNILPSQKYKLFINFSYIIIIYSFIKLIM